MLVKLGPAVTSSGLEGGGEVSQVVFVTDFFFGGGAVGMWGQMKALNENRVVRTGKGEFLGFV